MGTKALTSSSLKSSKARDCESGVLASNPGPSASGSPWPKLSLKRKD